MVIKSRVQIPGHFSTSITIAEKGILRDLLAFLIQSLADVYHTWRNDWRRQGNWIHNILAEIRQTSGSESGLIRKSGLESQISFGWAIDTLADRCLRSLSTLHFFTRIDILQTILLSTHYTVSLPLASSLASISRFIKPPLAIARAASCIGAVHLFVCLFVCLSIAKMQKNAIFSKK